MKPSMSLLAWYLRDYRPTCYIQNDSLSISGIRFHQDETHPFRPEYLYFSHADIWFEDPKYSGAYLAAHGQSTLFFWNCDYDELLNSLLSAFDFFNSWEGRLLDAAARQAPLQELLKISGQVLSNPATIADFEGRPLAAVDAGCSFDDPYWKLATEKGIVHPAVFHDHYYDLDGNPITNLSDKPVLVRNVYPEGAPVMMLYLKQDAEQLGGFSILQNDPELTEMNRQIAPFLARYFVKAREFSLPSGAVRSSSQIFQDLLAGQDVGTDNLGRLKNQLPPPPWRVVLLQHESRRDMIAVGSMANALRSQPAILLPVLQDSTILALMQDEHWNTAPNSLDLYNFCVCASMPMYDLSRINVCLLQAEFALDQAGSRAGFWGCEEFAFDYLLKRLKSSEMADLLLHPALSQLLIYDQENQTDLRDTLFAYLDNELILTETALQLHIHINTLKYRIRRIREITGLTLTDKNELDYLRLSCWLSRKA